MPRYKTIVQFLEQDSDGGGTMRRVLCLHLYQLQQSGLQYINAADTG
jgi:hypothetical protein